MALGVLSKFTTKPCAATVDGSAERLWWLLEQTLKRRVALLGRHLVLGGGEIVARVDRQAGPGAIQTL